MLPVSAGQFHNPGKMSKILAVFGATGQQGGSIVDFVLNDAELCQQYSVRGITRNVSSDSSLKLKQKGVDVVAADVTDPPSLNAALKGAHTVFAMTAPSFEPDSRAKEFATGKAIADAAVAEGLQYIILSTLPNVSKISEGKYTKVSGFDAKAEAEDYIRALPIKSAFLAPGSFMQNFHSSMTPRPDGHGGFVFARHVSPSSQLPLIDVAGDTGKFVGAILADPDKYEGKTFCAATKLYSMDDMARIMREKSGKTVKYVQIPQEQFKSILTGSVGNYAEALIEMMLYQQDFGYYGPQTKELVQWAVDNARGKPNTFEEYLDNHPLPLQQ